jgi:DNA-binding NarL/FixJ family response regulator
MTGSHTGGGVRTLIVDDEPDMRLLMRCTLQLEPALQITGEVGSGEEAIKAWQADRPDVIVMDLRMPGMSGLDAAEHILRKHPLQAIVLFSACLDAADRLRAVRIGVRACLDKLEFGRLAEVVLRAC